MTLVRNHKALGPEFTRRAVATGVQSSLSVALPVQHAIVGAFNLSSHASFALDEPATELALAFAGYAAVAIANAHLDETTPRSPRTCAGPWRHARSPSRPRAS